MRRRISSKSDTCTEGMDYDLDALRGVKVDAHCPGRSAGLPCYNVDAPRGGDGSAEVGRGISTLGEARTEGPNVKHAAGDLNFEEEETQGIELGCSITLRGGLDGIRSAPSLARQALRQGENTPARMRCNYGDSDRVKHSWPRMGAPILIYFMNRRVRNRTHGGEGGRGR